jgi:hypothetical protein
VYIYRERGGREREREREEREIISELVTIPAKHCLLFIIYFHGRTEITNKFVRF